MPFFFDVTPSGKTRAAPHGPFDVEAEADDAKALVEAELPDDTASAVYEAAADHHSTFAQAVMIYSTSEGERVAYSDGTEEPV